MSKRTVCNRCVMDNRSDDTITFDEYGNCNYCNYSLERMKNVYFPNEHGKNKLDNMIKMLKKEGEGKKYDCMMGLSGGLDSSYLAYLIAKYNLRILAIHIDDGFNTILAEENINKLTKFCNIDLIIEKPDKEQYMDLTRAFIQAGVPNIAIPQDNILLACLYNHAKRNKIKYFLSGANFALESILQRGNAHNAADKTHIKAISNEFGDKGINKLHLTSYFEKYIANKYFKNLNILLPLNFIDYNRERAINELNELCGFNYYGGKHYENIFTKFFQTYYLPKKFNIDKRTSHLSSLIISGQITREDALKELEKPLYDDEEMDKDIEYILSYLEMKRKDFNKIMNEPPRKHDEYKISFLINYAHIARKYRNYLGH
ncbi:N-acetyl sugar amidotransferase [Bacillus sp. FJAT-29790]|uniref:N-acetyl sugar amidotransferase n=1 Tax=Bacillus sp. FJAT-29790 TaxID=1895002 RepID=UPI001C22602B|nr:N-acetyl sugar amidotransferase [Bacillus sp. FJAT-29790]MBU8880779.1 N-acetyl sugar amidotransferase [Bacillus sp. FJAT-29790]